MIDATPYILEEIASELGLPLEQVRRAAESQFHFTAHVMARDTWQTVRLMYLGKWTVNPKRLKKVRELQLQGKIVPTKSGRDRVRSRPDNFDDIEQWEKQKNSE